MRFFTPVVLLLAAAYVLVHNQRSPDEVLALSFMGRVVPSIADDPRALGQASAGLLAAVGGLLLVRAALRRPPPEEA